MRGRSRAKRRVNAPQHCVGEGGSATESVRQVWCGQSAGPACVRGSVVVYNGTSGELIDHVPLGEEAERVSPDVCTTNDEKAFLVARDRQVSQSVKKACNFVNAV